MCVSVLVVLLMAFCCVGCATTGFTEHKKETLPDGTVHEYDEPLPFWMQIASVAKWILAPGEGKPDDHTSGR